MNNSLLRPVLLWSPLNGDTLPWLHELADHLASQQCQLVLLTTDPRPPTCPFATLHVPFCLPEYPARFARPSRHHALPSELGRMLAERSRAWWGQPEELLESHTAAVQAAARLFADLLRNLQPVCVVTWGSTLPQSVLLQHLAEGQRIPSFVLERGFFAGTLMIDQRGHGSRSDLNTSLAETALTESPLNPAAYRKARDYFLNSAETKYPHAAKLSPVELRQRHVPAGRKVVTFFGQWDVASGLLPVTSGDGRLQAPTFPTTKDGLLALQEAVRNRPGTVLLFKPHPYDSTDYEGLLNPETVLLKDVNPQDLIAASDVTALMLSTLQFEALLHDKPCLLLARSQLWGKGIAYEVDQASDLAPQLGQALAGENFPARCECQQAWLGGVLRNYLIRTRPEIPAGRSLEDLSRFLANNSLPANGRGDLSQRLHPLQSTFSGMSAPLANLNAPAEVIPSADSLAARLIAFFLPQFHPIPENDRWWGRGFTEWTNVSKATPRFPEHYQPHLPGELGFYDLRLLEARVEQARLARAHGIEGFCYWHYWFNGKRLLERPVEDLLASGQPDFPFCLAWANENWTRRWDGNDREMLQAQTYGGEADDRAHFECLLPALRDSRAIRVAGRPLFLIYRPANLPDPAATIRLWRQLAQEAGLPGLYLVAMRTCFDGEARDWRREGFDAEMYFQPDFSDAMQKHVTHVGLTKDRVVPYDQAWRAMSAGAEPYVTQRNAFPSVVPCWDNSARRKENSFIMHGSTPAEYAQWLRTEIAGVQSRPRDERVVFLNAWNEWAEGNHLEPDQRWGRAYLEATREIVSGLDVKEGRLSAGAQPGQSSMTHAISQSFATPPPAPAKPPQKPARVEKPFETTGSLVGRAMELVTAGNWAAAGEVYQVLTSRLPDELAAWHGRLECSRQQGHDVLADIILEEALELHPEWAADLKEPDGSAAQTGKSPANAHQGVPPKRSELPPPFIPALSTSEPKAVVTGKAATLVASAPRINPGDNRFAPEQHNRIAQLSAVKSTTAREIAAASAEAVIKVCQEYQVPDINYLKAHIRRYVMTRDLLLQQWPKEQGKRVLDIGAHWLHNALCFATAGFEVTASDLMVTNTLAHPNVIKAAAAHGIKLQPYHDLSNPVELNSLPSDSFDVILFAEILEHITFNPVRMWSQLYRLLRPGGRIVITTPNYHFRTVTEQVKQLASGRSAGITVDRLLETNTYGPHWKEYSAADIRDYFTKLSPDFSVSRLLFTDPYNQNPEAPETQLKRMWEQIFAAFPENPQLAELLADHLSQREEIINFKPSLHVEIDLLQKQRGITVEPHW